MEDGEENFHFNEYTWNKEVNMLYIEAPAGVGYSYCLDFKECNFNDTTSSQDNLIALLYFFEEKFPERKKNDLYISGESYAGVYVPYLAYQIDKFNEKYKDNDEVYKPNLKGFMVGNGVTNWTVDTDPAYIDMAYWHGLYSDSLLADYKENNCAKEFEGMEFKKDFSDPC